uniref:Uncharacterized protein n=1 Tax=Meloidogyne enterolobii TaxID=390850 RepID=A0A6V7WRW8_MELEN|nr:unnamed protein product [Meloidogyne enterolobii]
MRDLVKITFEMLNKQLSELSKQFSEIVKYEVDSIKKQEEITDKIWEILDENNGENIKVEELTNNGGGHQ